MEADRLSKEGQQVVVGREICEECRDGAITIFEDFYF
jgi:hypothetical protein